MTNKNQVRRFWFILSWTYEQTARGFEMYNAMKNWTKRGKRDLNLAFFMFKLQEYLQPILFYIYFRRY